MGVNRPQTVTCPKCGGPCTLMIVDVNTSGITVPAYYSNILVAALVNAATDLDDLFVLKMSSGKVGDAIFRMREALKPFREDPRRA